MGLGQILAKRIGYGLVLLVAVVVLNFTLITIAPGDVADSIAGDMGGADAEVLAEIRARYGLDQPFIAQLWNYLSKVAVLDLGYSYFYNAPVTELILQRLPATLLLVFSSQILAIALGMLLGVMAARKPNSLTNLIVTFLSLFGFAAPVFWTGILLIILFVSVWPVFPVGGMMSASLIGAAWYEQWINIAYHLVLPMVTLASIYLALYSRLTRASMQEVLGSDYVRTARAKGLGESTVVLVHVLRNSMIPVVTVIALNVPAVFGAK